MADQPVGGDTYKPEPTTFDLIAELRRAVGLFGGAMSITPKEAWEEAIAEVRRLRAVPHCPKSLTGHPNGCRCFDARLHEEPRRG